MIRLYRMAGDDDAAAKQVAAFTKVLGTELGVAPYLWLDVYILDAQCELGLRHGHADVSGWVETMRNLASRMDMRELALRSLRHGAALGHEGDAAAAMVLAEEIGALSASGLPVRS